MGRGLALLFLLLVLSSTGMVCTGVFDEWGVLSSTGMVCTGVFDEWGVLHTKGMPWSEEGQAHARLQAEAERARRVIEEKR